MKRVFCLMILMMTFFFLSAQEEKEVIVLIETNMGNMKARLYNNTPIHRDNFVQLARKGHYDGTLFYRVIKNFVIQGGSSDSRNSRPGQTIGFGNPMVIEAEMQPENYHKKGALAAPRQPDRVNFFKESDISQFYIVHGKKYEEKELDMAVRAVNLPIKTAIQKKHYTAERKVILDSLRAQKKAKEFNELATIIKQDIEFDWSADTRKIYMPDSKRETYIHQGGLHHLDKEYTVFGELIEGFEVIDQIANLETDANDRPKQDVTIKVKIVQE